MAIATYTSSDRYTDLVLGQVDATDLGYSFETVNVTKTATTRIGSLLAGATEIANAAAATANGVIVWVDSYNGLDDFAVGATVPCVVAKRAVTLNQNKLVFTDGAVNATAITALNAFGIKVTSKIVS
jgi:hypothetical protein